MKVTEHCKTCTCVDTWPGLPDGHDGIEIRSRKIYLPPMTTRPVRDGGAEPKMIVAETGQWVIYRVWSSKGQDLGELISPRPAFDAEFERRTS
jgi:hypothetical protein